MCKFCGFSFNYLDLSSFRAECVCHVFFTSILDTYGIHSEATTKFGLKNEEMLIYVNFDVLVLILIVDFFVSFVLRFPKIFPRSIFSYLNVKLRFAHKTYLRINYLQINHRLCSSVGLG